jgi:hypothetical protein
MFVVHTSGAKACRKMSVLMGIALAITGSFAAILTLHVYARPGRAAPTGFRLLGFPRNRTRCLNPPP